jgi:predicted dehydrogenase
MNLTPELEALGRRNFLKAAAGVPALAALAGAAAIKGPKSGGPVKAGIVGLGGEGKVLLNQCDRAWIDIRAVADINPEHSKKAADGLAKQGVTRPREYQDYKQMLEKEDLEAVLIATPLWTHADISVACLEAGKHVLCEKMMSWDVASGQRMLDAARKAKRVLEIGHQRFYNPIYQTAREGLINKGMLGDVHYIRTVWHRNGSWRRDDRAPSASFDPKPWGYDDWEHLANWRLFAKYSRGLLAELGSHQIAIANWYYDAVPEAVYASGGVHRYKDGREVPDHVYATFEYPGGRTATFTSIQSNAYDETYEQIMGTKGTLILKGETGAYFFNEHDGKATNLEVSKRSSSAIVDASESRVADTGKGRTVTEETGAHVDRLLAYRLEINGFCSAVRANTPLVCGPERALGSAAACIRAYESCEKKTRLTMV